MKLSKKSYVTYNLKGEIKNKNKMDAKQKIIKARVKIQKENPFFSYLCLNLNMIEEKKEEKESVLDKIMGGGSTSIGVNARGDCIYNPDWIDEITSKGGGDDGLGYLKGVLVHECLHLGLLHFDRDKKGTRDHNIMNIANDLVINNILVSNGFSLPEGLVPSNNSFTFENEKLTINNLDKKSSEEVYEEIMKSGKVKTIKQKCVGVGFDTHIFGKSDKDKKGEGVGKGEGEGGRESSKLKSELEKQKAKWKKVFAEASIYAKQQGNLPEGMQRLVDMVLNERVSWKHLLYKYITNELPFDYSWSFPSKRAIATGIYLPHIRKENLEVVVSIDTSGSIEQEELNEFLGEIVNIAKSFNNISMTLIVCDCEVKDVYKVANGDIAKIQDLKIRGGGGTSHIPIYNYIEKNLPNTKFVINFTDGFTDFPDYEKTKTIWVLTKNSCGESKIPFGEVINLN